MRLSISPFDDDVFVLEVPEDTLLSGLKMLISVECGKPQESFIIMKDGEMLRNPDSRLHDLGFKENDVVVMVPAPQFGASQMPGLSQSRTNQRAPSGTSIPQGSNAETLRQTILRGPPHVLERFKRENPDLVPHLHDATKFKSAYEAQLTARAMEVHRFKAALNADPLNPEVQAKIAEMIRHENLDSQLEVALEHHPETFCTVPMLFIRCKVENQPAKAFVDSGAQTTIISLDFAKRCNLESKIDLRWPGTAMGIGTQTIIGRIHCSYIEIEGVLLPTSFTVLKEQRLDLLFGLDLLKRYQCCIDLKNNYLLVDGRIKAPFLPESEIPDCVRFGGPDTDDSCAYELSSFSPDKREKVLQLVSQGVPQARAIAELQTHDWDLDAALVAFMSSDGALQ